MSEISDNSSKADAPASKASTQAPLRSSPHPPLSASPPVENNCPLPPTFRTTATKWSHQTGYASASLSSPYQFRADVREHAAREELDVVQSTPASLTAPQHARRTNANRKGGGDAATSLSSSPLFAMPVNRPKLDAGSASTSSSTTLHASPPASDLNDGGCVEDGVLDVGELPVSGPPRSNAGRSKQGRQKHAKAEHTGISEGEDGCADVVAVREDSSIDGSDGCLRYISRLPVVGDACVRFVDLAERSVPPGGHLSNIFNMASNTLGIGIVSMASGFNTTGIGLAVILMIVCAVLVVFSFYLIGITCERSPYRSWESACRGILFRGADYCVAGLMIFFQFGTMVGFVTAAHDLIGPFISDAASATGTPHTKQRVVTAIVWFFGMFPLCLPRRVASLRYFSIVGVTLVIYFVFAVVAHSAMAGLPHLHDMKIFASGLDAVNGLTLFIFAFLGHGLCFRLFDEMQVPSAKNLFKDGCGSVSLIGVLYFIVGFFGYAEFGLDMTGSIFKFYSVRDEPMMLVAYIGILLKICVAYALSNQACRLPVYYILRRNIDHTSYQLHLIITIPLCVFSLIMGMYVPDINIVFNLLGSICGGILAFLLPAFFVMYIGGWTLKRIGWFRLSLTYLNIIAGVVAIVFGTAVTIDGMVKTYG